MAKVDWKSLRHAHGSAKDLSKYLRALKSDDRVERESALLALIDGLAYRGKWFTATPPVVDTLLPMVARGPDAEHASALAADLIAGGHVDRWLTPVDEPVPKKAAKTVAGAVAHGARLLAALESADPGTRAGRRCCWRCSRNSTRRKL